MPQPQSTNPFEGLLTTDALSQKRLGEAMQMAGNDPNKMMFAQNLVRFQDSLRQQGIGLDKEDLRAQRNDAILKSSAQAFGSRTNEGQLDPDEAMSQTLEDAFQQMLKAGDSESAAVIAPHIFAQRAQAAELDKLRAETAYTKARPEIDQAKADTAQAKADAAAARLDAQNAKDQAMAGYYNRMPKNGGAGGATTTPSGYTKFRSQGGSVVGLLSQLGDLYDIYVATPGVASQPAATISSIADSVKGAKELVAPENKAYNFDLADQLSKQNSSVIAGLSKSLNVDRGLLESTVVDTAYTLARARDPGGRISNADYDNAIRLLGAAKDPARAKAVLLDLGRRTARDFQNQAKANPDFEDEPVIGQVADAYGALLERAKGKRTGPKTPPPATTPKGPPPSGDMSTLSDAELQRIANGG